MLRICIHRCSSSVGKVHLASSWRNVLCVTEVWRKPKKSFPKGRNLKEREQQPDTAERARAPAGSYEIRRNVKGFSFWRNSQ